MRPSPSLSGGDHLKIGLRTLEGKGKRKPNPRTLMNVASALVALFPPS
jgi:hypothetical protein